MEKSVKVGVALITFRRVRREPTEEERALHGADFECFDTYALLGQRQGSHAAGQWACSGGHLEYGETAAGCCERELLEECGLVPTSEIKHVGWVEVTYEEVSAHHVTLFLWCECAEGEPKLMEPKKCKGWGWFKTSELPSPLMEQTDRFIALAEQEYLREIAARG